MFLFYSGRIRKPLHSKGVEYKSPSRNRSSGNVYCRSVWTQNRQIDNRGRVDVGGGKGGTTACLLLLFELYGGEIEKEEEGGFGDVMLVGLVRVCFWIVCC